MMDDDDGGYMSFLDKANQPTGMPSKSSSNNQNNNNKPSSSSAAAKDQNLPAALTSITATYTSDTDAPFEPVSLPSTSTSLPTAASFASLVHVPRGDVEELTEEEFDPQGQYAEVLDRVKGCVQGGHIKVFWVQKRGARVEYWIVGVRKAESEGLVGVKAEAVES